MVPHIQSKNKKVFLYCRLVAAWDLILMRGATLNALHHLVASHDAAQWLIKVLQKPVGRTATSSPQRKSISAIVCSLSNVKMPSATAESKLNSSISLLPAWLLRATCSRYFLPLKTKQMLIGCSGLRVTKNAFHIKTCQDRCARYLTGTLSDPSALQVFSGHSLHFKLEFSALASLKETPSWFLPDF